MQHPLNLKYHYRLNYQRNSNILAKDYGVIYFNTQKNANSSLKAQFVEILEIPKTEKFPKDIHYGYDFPCATKAELNTTYQDFLKFAVLRNPWERLYSCYKNKIAQSSKTGPDYILECSPDFQIGMPFEDFVEVVCAIPDSEADYHFCSQIYLMLLPDGTLPINYLCNMENLDIHLAAIKSKTGIPFTSLSRLNSSAKSTYESVYTPQLVEKVGARYWADIELFKYEFGKKNEAFSFGEVSKDLINLIETHSFMNVILKEKNRELVKEIALKDAPLIRKMKKDKKKLKNEIATLQKKLDAVINSRSWRVTAPLRRLRK